MEQINISKRPVLFGLIIKMSSSKPTGTLPKSANFALGGLASVSGWLFVHPFDVLKVRMQISTEGGSKGITNL